MVDLSAMRVCWYLHQEGFNAHSLAQPKRQDGMELVVDRVSVA